MSGPTPESLASPGTEQAHQTALFCWAALNTYKWPELSLLFAIPNGGTRNRLEAAFLKASGVRAGVPDTFLPVSRWNLHGLFIEMKRRPNKPTADQLKWMIELDAGGYAAVVAYSWEEARDYLQAYLEEHEKTSLSDHRSFAAVASSIWSRYSPAE